MANVASILKEEITRLARKEIRTETESLKKSSTQYRSEIAALKKRATALEKQVASLVKSANKAAGINTTNAKTETDPGNGKKTRFVAKGFKSLRQRLGLTAGEIGRLLGVPAQTVYNWEADNAKPREQQLVLIARLRGMGKRDVAKILAGISQAE